MTKKRQKKPAFDVTSDILPGNIEEYEALKKQWRREVRNLRKRQRRIESKYGLKTAVQVPPVPPEPTSIRAEISRIQAMRGDELVATLFDPEATLLSAKQELISISTVELEALYKYIDRLDTKHPNKRREEQLEHHKDMIKTAVDNMVKEMGADEVAARAEDIASSGSFIDTVFYSYEQNIIPELQGLMVAVFGRRLSAAEMMEAEQYYDRFYEE